MIVGGRVFSTAVVVFIHGKMKVLFFPDPGTPKTVLCHAGGDKESASWVRGC